MPPEIKKIGLSTKEAELSLKKYGLNELKGESKRSIVSMFLSQFNNMLIMLLVVAGLFSALAGEQIETFFIVGIILLNTLFGMYQEYKADESLALLKDMTTSMVRVVRDGTERELDSLQIVPGDVVYLEEGSKIPADGELISSTLLEIDEAALTGESIPIEKSLGQKGDNTLYMGTVVVRGHAYIKITKTSSATRFGMIAQSMGKIVTEATPLQKKLTSLSKMLGIFGITASVIVFIISYIKHQILLTSFLFAVSLAVAAVPEGLPAVMTITLAVGVKRMARRKAIVRHLESIEALGATTLIATDKTGTLTQNRMQVQYMSLGTKDYSAHSLPLSTNPIFEKVLLTSVLCSTASLVSKAGNHRYDILGDPTEGSLLIMAKKCGINIDTVRTVWKKREEESFDQIKKRMMVTVQNGATAFVLCKGAPESVLQIADHTVENNKVVKLTERRKQKLLSNIEKYAREGYRMIGFSYKKRDKFKTDIHHIFLGCAAIADEIRPEAARAVLKAQNAGIQVVMITGDNAYTAEHIGIKCHIINKGEDIIEGKQIDEYTDDELIKILPSTKIFARTTPEHKHRLVKLYQKIGHVVTVTGDGVNDALALKQADVGVAMGETGTDVARETADMVITDDNFSSLITAIEEGRNIFTNIKKAVKYLLATNFAEVLVVISTMLLTESIALTALQILYINLVSDGLPALSLAFTPSSSYVMNQKPTTKNTLLSRTDIGFILTVGLTGSILTLIGFMLGAAVDGIATSRSMAFTTAIFMQPLVLMYLWSTRHSLGESIHLLKKPLFAIAFVLPYLIHPALLYTQTGQQLFEISPLTPPMIILSLMLSLLILLPLEIRKTRSFAEKNLFSPSSLQQRHLRGDRDA